MIVTRERGYHGLHAFGTSLAGIEANREGYGSPSLVPETARVPTHDLTPLAAMLAEHGDRVAAVFLEAVIGTGGFIPPAPGYLQTVQELCKAHDVLLVLDEVITGFGRTGALFAADRVRARAGHPAGRQGHHLRLRPAWAALVGERVCEPFWRSEAPAVFRHGLTYSGHATACAVAHANLDILERDQLVARVAQLEPVLGESLATLAGHPQVAEIRGPVGLMAGVRLRNAAAAESASRRRPNMGCWCGR